MVNFSQFLLLVFLLVLVPGPDYVIITKNAVTAGKSAGIKTILGTSTALLLHTSFAVFGLSALIIKSAFLYTGLKYLGALYLIYLGIKSLFSKVEQKTSVETTQKNVFVQGLMTNVLNPKVAVFFLTFLPQFVQHNNQSWLPFAFLGLTYVAVTFMTYSVYVIFLTKLKKYLEKSTVQQAINKISGLILVIFGVRLFIEKT